MAENQEEKNQTNIVSEKIKKLLHQKGKSQKDLCKYLVISENGLGKMLKRGTFKTDTLAKIAKFLEVDESELLLDPSKPVEESISNTLPTLERLLGVMEKQADALLKNSGADQEKSKALNQNAEALNKYADTISRQHNYIEELGRAAQVNGFKKVREDIEKIRVALNEVLKDKLKEQKRKTG